MSETEIEKNFNSKEEHNNELLYFGKKLEGYEQMVHYLEYLKEKEAEGKFDEFLTDEKRETRIKELKTLEPFKLKSIQVVENAGDWYLRGHKIMAVNLQAHGATKMDKISIFVNTGSITGLNEVSEHGYLGEQVAFMFTEGLSMVGNRGFDNLGKIEMRAPLSVIYHHHNDTGTGSHYLGSDIMLNSGIAKIYGRQSAGYTAKDNSFNLDRAILKLDKPITLLGDQNIGAVISKPMYFDQFKLKFDIGTEDPRQNVEDPKGKDNLENSGNMLDVVGTDGSIKKYDNRLTEETTGLYTKVSEDFDLKDFQVNMGKYAKDSVGLRVENTNMSIGDMNATYDTEIKNFIHHTSDASLEDKDKLTTGNILVYTAGGNTSLNLSYDTELKVKDSKETTGIFVDASEKVVNKAGINIENSPESIGIFIKNKDGEENTVVENYNDIIVKGKNGIAVANYGSFKQLPKDSTKPEIKTRIEAEGEKGIAVYTKNSSAPLELNSVDIKANDGAVALFADANVGEKSTIKLKDVSIDVGENGLLSFNYSGTGTTQVGDFELVTDTNATIGKGAVAFYNRGNIESIPSYLNMLKGNKNLNITLKDGARLFVLDNPSSVFTLSSLITDKGITTFQNTDGTARVNVSVEQGGDFRYYTANGGTLNIDENVDLSNANDNYFKNDIMSASVNVINPITNNGKAIANGTKYAIAQKNYDSTEPNRVKIKVDNAITLTQAPDLVGVAVDGGIVENNNAITVSGEKGTGVLLSNNSSVINKKDIIIGDKGVGILALNKLADDYDSGNFNITQDTNSKIEYRKAGAVGDKAYGIVAKNNDVEDTKYSATVKLENSSTIDLVESVEGIGVLLKGSKINFTDNGSTVKVGEKGIGIVIDDKSTIAEDKIISNLNSGKVIANGDEAIAIHSNSELVSTKEVEVSGKKSVGYYAKGALTVNAGITVEESKGTEAEKTMGVYGKDKIELNSGIAVGKNSIGIYGGETENLKAININANANLTIKDKGVGVYANKGKITLNSDSTFNIGNNDAIGVYGINGSEIVNNSNNYNIGENSYGFVLENSKYTGNVQANLTKDGSVYLYAEAGEIAGLGNITATGNKEVGVYGFNGTTINVNNDIDLSAGKGNIGIYSEAGNLTHSGNVVVGESIIDLDEIKNSNYSIGFVGTKGANLNLKNADNNTNTITIKGNNGIGIYASGNGTRVENRKNIVFAPDLTKKTDRMIGLFLNDGATAVNYGNISTAENYLGNKNVSGLVGVSVINGTLENHGNIEINAENSVGMVLSNAVLKNYGEIVVKGKRTNGILYDADSKGADETLLEKNPSKVNVENGIVKATEEAKDYTPNYIPDKIAGEVELTVENGKAIIKRNGKEVSDTTVNLTGTENNLWFSNVGMYVDTLGKTKPIQIDGFKPNGINDLIIGAEATTVTNNKNIRIPASTMKKFTDWIKVNKTEVGIMSGALNWIGTYDLKTGETTLAKRNYKDYSSKELNEYNFLDGLEQRYDKNALNSNEKKLFNKLNSIGNNEGILFSQAVDNMMGHQYSNVQQRINETGNILDKEFKYLRKEWDTKSKDSNKVKAFGMNGSYKTETAGVYNYKNNAQGFVYLHENESIKLGNTTAWYGGFVHNKFEFDDYGKSSERMHQVKLGALKSRAYDDNNSLNWTTTGEIFGGRNYFKRNFLVVDEVFNAKSEYWTYGIGMNNELSKTFRLSEDFSVRPYGELKLEYGRFSKIKEKNGAMRLEIKANDYYSIKPEVGTEISYKHELKNNKTFTARLGVSYQNELGKVADTKNKGRVAYTTADWFDIRGEKENRSGNLKTDLNIGLDNERYGITANVGYDTMNKNARGGVGFRIIY